MRLASLPSARGRRQTKGRGLDGVFVQTRFGSLVFVQGRVFVQSRVGNQFAIREEI